MRIATWNVNSVRIRLDLLKRLADTVSPDVLCLQETKVQDPQFPVEALAEMGWGHHALYGMKSYNGVAVFSRFPIEDATRHHWCGKKDARHLSVQTGGIRIHNLYIPAGGDIPDPEENDKFAHKLSFVDELTSWAKDEGKKDKTLLLGDFNIAPLAEDVWSHKQLLKIISHTPIETDGLNAWQKAGKWDDLIRHHKGSNTKLYSWWSYRARDWAKSNRGRRLDHIWGSKDMTARMTHAEIVTEARGWERPSDHVPVYVDIEN